MFIHPFTWFVSSFGQSFDSSKWQKIAEVVEHKQVLLSITFFCAVELSYTLGQEGGFQSQQLKHCVVAHSSTTNGLLLVKSLLFFCGFFISLIRASETRRNLLQEHTGHLEILKLSVVSSCSELKRDCLLGLLTSLNVLLRAGLMILLKDKPDYIRLVVWAPLITQCFTLAF